MEHEAGANQVLIDNNLSKVVAGLKALNISLPDPSPYTPAFEGPAIGGDTELKALEDPGMPIGLSAENGAMLAQINKIYAYDESIDKHMCLEGEAYLTSHALIRLDKEDYTPTVKICLGFYTKSPHLAKLSGGSVTQCDNTVAAYREGYTQEKVALITTFTVGPSIILVDGPLQAGTYDLTMLKMEGHFAKNNILPAFVVKNSDSSVVINSDKALKDKYHSDLHWAHKTLQAGERTSFFYYNDKINKNIHKCFAYMLPFKPSSPIRVEFHSGIYHSNPKKAHEIMDLLYYLYIVQGRNNPQPRPIVIAEKFARATLHLFNLRSIVAASGAFATMNEERGMVR